MLLTKPTLYGDSLADLFPEAGKAFSTVAIQSGGRVMPVASYGESLLRSLSGRSRIEGMDGEDFFFRLLFDFSSLSDLRFIRIYHPDLVTVLSLDSTDYYSLNDLNPAIETLAYLYQNLVQGREEAIEPDTREGSENTDPLLREIISLYEKLRTIFLLSSAFDSPLPGQHFDDSPLKLIPLGNEFLHPRDPLLPSDRGSSLADIAEDIIESIAAARPDESRYPLLDEQLASSLRELSDMQGSALSGLGFRLALERVYRVLRPFRLAAVLLIVGGLLLYAVLKMRAQTGPWKRPLVICRGRDRHIRHGFVERGTPSQNGHKRTAASYQFIQQPSLCRLAFALSGLVDGLPLPALALFSCFRCHPPAFSGIPARK